MNMEQPSELFSKRALLGKDMLAEKLAASRCWMLLNKEGESVILEVDKYVVMHRVGMHARDLRILDPLLSYPSTILGRERAIVVNLEHIKAIITADEVFLRNPNEDTVIPVVQQLGRRLPSQSVQREGGCETDDISSEDPPFEFRALEIVLEAICSFLDARTTELENAAYPALEELTSEISSRNLDRVRKQKTEMTRLTGRVQKVRDELEQLLDDDDDMAELYLTRKKMAALLPPASTGQQSVPKFKKSSSIHSQTSDVDIEVIEMLLEAYFMQIDGTLNRLNELREYIDDTEDYINIQLDSHRNHLIQLELIVSSGSVALSIFALVAAIFGMNIPHPWNYNHPHIFKWVIIVTGTMCLIIFCAIMSHAGRQGLIG